MKKYFYIALSTVIGFSTISLTSCGDNPTEIETKIETMTLTVDKSTIEANNEEVATFTVTDQTGRVVSDMKLKDMRIMNTLDNSFVETKKPDYRLEVKAYENATNSYVVRYDGKRTNEVKVTGVNRKKYEKYYRNIAMYQATGTWCVNCPTLTKTLTQVATDYMPNRMIRMAYHANGSSADPFHMLETATLMSQFKLGGYPSGVVDLRDGFGNTSAVIVMDALRKSLAEYPATCGIKISATIDKETKKLVVSPEVTFEKSGEYSVGWTILADNVVSPQSMPDGSVSNDYVHNNTVRWVSNLYGTPTTPAAMTDGKVWTPEIPKNYEMVLPENLIKDTRVVVFVLKKYGEEWHINNIATCAADGGSVAYKLNE